MTEFVSNGVVDHGLLVDAFIFDMFGTDYVQSDLLDGYTGPAVGRTCFHNAKPSSSPLGGRQFVEKLISIVGYALSHEVEFENVSRKVSCTPTHASEVVLEVLRPFLGSSRYIDLRPLVISEEDSNLDVAQKSKETVCLVEILLDSLDKNRKTTSFAAAKARAEKRLDERLGCFELASGCMKQADLSRAVIKHNELVQARSGTYHLDCIVRELVPGIIQEDRNALFEYRDDDAPLVQCLQSSWRERTRPNLMLVGEGGIGKTVAMQEASISLCDVGIPAVYIPLHAVPYLNLNGSFIQGYIAKTVLRDNEELCSSFSSLLSTMPINGRPNVVLLLDGWNEINERRTAQGWLTDAVKEEVETCLATMPGLQIVLAGRARMDVTGSWNSRWVYSRVKRLDRGSIGRYLDANSVKLPSGEDPVWEVLGNPLMLTLYVCSARQGASCGGNACCSFIEGDRARSQAAIIWNFLQCQINKAMVINKERGAAFPDLLAINYAAAFIGWSMERSGDFRISLRRLSKLIEDAGERYAHTWQDSAFVANAKHATGSRSKKWDSDDIEAALLDGVGLLLGKTDDKSDRIMDENRVGFLHQKFRDFYAALLFKLEFDPYGIIESPEESNVWVESATTHEVLNLLAGIMDEDQIRKLWEATREMEAKADSFALFHLAEVAQRNDMALADLGFQNLNLRFTSIQDRGVSTSDRLDFREALVSNKTLLPLGHTEYVSDVVWRPRSGGSDGDQMISFGQSAVIWDACTSLPYAEVVHSQLRPYNAMAVSSDGEVIALSSEGEGFCLFSIDSKSNKLVPMEDAPRISTMAFAPNGRVLACGGEAGVLFLFDLETRTKVDLVMPSEISGTYDWRSILEVCFSANGETLGVLYESGAISLWRMFPDWLEKPPALINATDIGDDVYEIQLNKDGSSVMILTVYGEFSSCDVEELLDWEDVELAVEGFDSIGYSYAHNIAVATCENEMMVLELDNGSNVKQLKMVADLNSAVNEVLTISISPSGDKAMCIHENNVITVWDTRPSFDADERPLMAVENRRNSLGSIRVMGDGRLACSTGLDYFLEWTPDCVVSDQFYLVGTAPEYWDYRVGDSVFVQVFENSIGLYNRSCDRFASFTFNNRFQDVRFADGGSRIAALENTPGLVCLDGKTLEEQGSVLLEDEVVAIAPMPNGNVLGITDDGSLIEWGLPRFKEEDRWDVWISMKDSPDEATRGLADRFFDPYIPCRMKSPEYVQLECYRDVATGKDYALAVFEAHDLEIGSESQLMVKVDLAEGDVCILDVDEESNKTQGLAIMPDEGVFFLTSSQGWIESRSLETGEVLKNVEPIPNLNLVGADFRGAVFDNDTLRDMVRASGGVL